MGWDDPLARFQILVLRANVTMTFPRACRRSRYRIASGTSLKLVISRDPTCKLRQFQIESVNFVNTQVTDEESRAIGSNIAPGTSGTTLESGQGLQIGQKFRASLADLYALKSGMVAERNVVVKVVPV